MNNEVDDVVLKECTPPNFEYFSKPRGNSRHGGIAMFIRCGSKDDVKCTDVNVNYANLTMECMHATIRFIDSSSICFLGIYRPPKSESFVNFLGDLKEVYLDVILSGKVDEVILLGDFNVHVDILNDNHHRSLKNTMLELGLTQHVNFATHTAGHTLDLVITSDKSSVVEDIHQSNIVNSDHVAILVTTNIGLKLIIS